VPASVALGAYAFPKSPNIPHVYEYAFLVVVAYVSGLVTDFLFAYLDYWTLQRFFQALWNHGWRSFVPDGEVWKIVWDNDIPPDKQEMLTKMMAEKTMIRNLLFWSLLAISFPPMVTLPHGGRWLMMAVALVLLLTYLSIQGIFSRHYYVRAKLNMDVLNSD
jgi:hypothetical protein